MLVIDVQGARQVRARCPGTVGVLRAAAVVRRSSSSGCAAAARTAKRRCSGGSQTARAEVAAFAGIRLRRRQRRARGVRRSAARRSCWPSESRLAVDARQAEADRRNRFSKGSDSEFTELIRMRSSSSSSAGARARQLLRGCTPTDDRQRQAGAARAAGSRSEGRSREGGRRTPPSSACP